MKYLDFKTILILALAIVILLLKLFSCNNQPPIIQKVGGKTYEVIKKEIDTQYVERIKTVTKKGKDITHDTTIYVPIPTHEPIDTLALLKNYYAKNVFKDTLKLDDSFGFISVIDTISQNKIYSRTWDSKLLERKITDKLVVKELKNQLFIGGVLGFDKTNIINFAGPSLLIKNKKDNVYSIGVGYSNNKTISLQGGIYWKIRLKK